MKSKAGKQWVMIEAVLTLAADHGWDGVTANRLAKKTRTPLTASATFLDDPTRLMCMIAEYITANAHDGYKHDPRNNPREALFELMMLRFDILQRHRGGILALHRAARSDPRLLTAMLCAVHAQLAVILKTAIEAGLGTVYTLAFCVWRNDGSADLAPTMAALDRGLRRAESAARFMLKQERANG